jgi:hypothetical protein
MARVDGKIDFYKEFKISKLVDLNCVFFWKSLPGLEKGLRIALIERLE